MSCAVFAAQGCGIIGGGKEEDDAKVLRIGVYQKQTEVNVIKAVIAAFKKAYPDYLAEQGLSDIKIREIAESEYTTKIQGMAQTGTLPDVFLNIDATAPMFATQKVSLDLMPYVEANEEYADIIADMYAPMYAQGVFGGEFHMAASIRALLCITTKRFYPRWYLPRRKTTGLGMISPITRPSS